MSLAPFENPDRTPNPAALVQTSALLQCLHWNVRTEAEALLAFVGGGTIRVWVYQPESIVVSYAIIEDGDTLYVVMDGTANAAQWVAQITGATGGPYRFDARVNVAQWWDALAHPLAQVVADFVEPHHRTLRLTGHSLGGAMTHLVANEAARNPGNLRRIEVLNWAPPNPLCEGYRGPGPDVHHRIYHPQDIVPLLPPAGFNSQFYRLDSGGWFFGDSLIWGYYGTGWHLDDSARLTHDFELRPRILAAAGALAARNLGVHLIQEYADDAGQLYEAITGEPRVNAWRTVVQAVAQRPDPTQPGVLPPADERLSAAAAAAAYFPGVNPAIVAGQLAQMASARLGVSGGIVGPGTNIGDNGVFPGGGPVSANTRIALIINNGRYGRQIAFVLNGAASRSAAILAGKNLAKLVAKTFGSVLGNGVADGVKASKSVTDPLIEFMRVSDATDRILGKLEDLGTGEYRQGNLTANKHADFFATALSVQIEGATVAGPARRSRSSHLFVGQPDDVYRIGVARFDLPMPPGPTFGDRFKAVLQELTASPRAWGYMGIDPAQALIGLSGFVVAGGVWTFTAAPAPNWESRDRIRITASNGKGFNGVWRVLKIDDTHYMIPRGPSTTIPAITTAEGRRVQLANGTRVQVFYRFQTPEGGWEPPFGVKIRKKNPGREFNPESFRKRERPVRQ